VKIAKKSPGYQPLVVSALKDAAQGITSLEEVLRVAEQIDESEDYMDVA
jgi:MSHA biogenesis protein MshE